MTHELFNASHYLVDRQLEGGNGRRTAVMGPLGSVTYDELADLVTTLAAGWRAAGLRHEERVLLLAADSTELLAALLSVMRVGAVPVPVPTVSTSADLAGFLKDSRATYLVVGPQCARTAQHALELAGTDHDVTAVVVLSDAPVQPPSTVIRLKWEHLVAAGRAGLPDGTAPDRTTEDSPALWLYTSGSTGAPKAAMHRHASVRCVAEGFGQQVLGIGPGDRCFSMAKLSFAYGLGNSCFLPLAAGATTVLSPDRPTAESVLRRLREDDPTIVFGVPAHYLTLVQAGEIPDSAFARVRIAVSAGDPLPDALQKRFRERFGTDLLDAFGSTEALHVYLSRRPGAEWAPVPGYDLSVLTEEGATTAPGQPGFLHVRAPSAATGYWSWVRATRDVFRGEWISTADVFSRSEEGGYSFQGRSGDMIKTRGLWVSPIEVESELLRHPSVAQAAVVGVPSQDGLERPVACVVPTPGHSVSAAQLIEFCRACLPPHKRPDRVLFLDALPTTSTGKTRRQLVRDHVLAQPPGGTDVTGRPGPSGEEDSHA
ncbi:benzoate-CoA ligase family protein [Streptomyces lavendulae]|uniref:benzoate-CoA ligase family protein n=1 Tax=Streptomyces lavendulae TaxID=1914 RepID=UPI0024A53103|nr:benzoate-CoA ligase family protein [Streptomyces lavendulae]GLW04066.1 benzoate--CoA ligase [Streptomyces lavendulae subsp. lavendulae]